MNDKELSPAHRPVVEIGDHVVGHVLAPRPGALQRVVNVRAAAALGRENKLAIAQELVSPAARPTRMVVDHASEVLANRFSHTRARSGSPSRQ